MIPIVIVFLIYNICKFVFWKNRMIFFEMLVTIFYRGAAYFGILVMLPTLTLININTLQYS